MAAIKSIKVGGTVYTLDAGSGNYVPMAGTGTDVVTGNIRLEDTVSIANASGDTLILYDEGVLVGNDSGDTLVLLSSDQIKTQSSILPIITGTDDLGSTSYRYKDLYLSNKGYAAKGFFQSSDERLKNAFGEIDLNKSYELIDKCQTIAYTLINDPENKEQIGVIAQLVREFFPEIVSEDENGFLSVDYSKLTVIILRVLKDLIDRVKNLENKE